MQIIFIIMRFNYCSRTNIVFDIITVWCVFVFREDMYAQDSIELLTTSGIQFKKHEDEGIEALYFAELMMTSGVVLCDGVKWLSFHRYSRYSAFAVSRFFSIIFSRHLHKEKGIV